MTPDEENKFAREYAEGEMAVARELARLAGLHRQIAALAASDVACG